MDIDDIGMPPLSPLGRPFDTPCVRGCNCRSIDMDGTPYTVTLDACAQRYPRDSIVSFFRSYNVMSFSDAVLDIYDDPMSSCVKDYPLSIIPYAAAAFQGICCSSRFTATVLEMASPKEVVDVSYIYFCTIYLRLHNLDDVNKKWIMKLVHLYAMVKREGFSVEDVMQKFRVYYEKNKKYLRHRFHKYEMERRSLNILGDYDDFIGVCLKEFRVEYVKRTVWELWEVNTTEELECPVGYMQWLPREVVDDITSVLI